MHGDNDTVLTTDPDDLEFHQVVSLLVEDPLYLEAREFYNGNHFQDGRGWIGPRIDDDELGSTDVMEEIEATLIPHPALEEVVDRHKDAVTNEPTWSITPIRDMEEDEEPTDREAVLIREQDAALTAWWDAKDALGVLQDTVVDFELGGRGLMRVITPEGELMTAADGTPMIPRGTLQESLNRIWPLFMDADQAEVLRHPLSMENVGVYVYEINDAVTGKSTQIAELTFLDSSRQTVIKRLVLENGAGGGKSVVDGRVTLDLGGRLTMFKMRGKRLITRPVIANQKLLNLDLTMMGKNVVLGGFLERVILNGQPPGDWEEDDDGKQRFVPGVFKTGGHSVNWVDGKVIAYDKDTKDPILATPNVIYKDPVPPDTFTKTQDSTYRNILQGVKQLHVVISGDAIASGESRKQARDDYEKSLKKTKTRVDALGKWLLETVLAQAAVYMGQPGRYDAFRIDFDCQIDAGPISAEDRNSMLNEVARNVRSRESYMIAARVTKDPDAMKRKILTEVAVLPPPENPALPGGPNDSQSGRHPPAQTGSGAPN